MSRDPIPLVPPHDALDAVRARQRFVELFQTRTATPDELADRYERTVFPHAAAGMIAGRADTAPAELLVVPVGTQPYSPLLAVLATPSPRVALLVTSESGAGLDGSSRPFAERVRAAVEAGLDEGERPVMELFELGDGTSGARVVRAVEAALLWAGDPWPSDVVLDVTGGKKATTAALGGLAAAYGFKQTYIEGQVLAGPYRQHERRHQLADIGALTMGEARSAATALLEEGAFEAAARRFQDLLETTAAVPPAHWLGALAAALVGPRPEALRELAEGMPACRARDLLLEDPGLGAGELARRFVDALREEGAWR